MQCPPGIPQACGREQAEHVAAGPIVEIADHESARLQHREQPPGLWKSRSGVAGCEVRVGQRQNALGEAKPDQLGDAPPVAPWWDAPR
jgi:hypothetical protein